MLKDEIKKNIQLKKRQKKYSIKKKTKKRHPSQIHIE
jgi:hypothetical protein